ncbi:MAG TPA: glycoside hydrolase family 3 protein, partial [Mycobacterium sp.]
MARRLFSLRGFAAVSTLLLLVGCSAPASKSAPPSSAPAGSSSAASVAPLKAPAPAAPAPPMCGDPTTLPTRDRLAQLLMVGVRDGADAR